MRQNKGLKATAVVLGVVAAATWIVAALGMFMGEGSTSANPAHPVKVEVLTAGFIDIDAQPAQLPVEDVVEEVPEQPASFVLTADSVAGTWDLELVRHYWLGGADGSLIATEIVQGTLEIPAGQSEDFLEMFFMPTLFDINGTPNTGSLPDEPNMLTGFLDGDSMYIYLSLDAFYMDPTLDFPGAQEPDYFQLVVTDSAGQLEGRGESQYDTYIEDDLFEADVTLVITK